MQCKLEIQAQRNTIARLQREGKALTDRLKTSMVSSNSDEKWKEQCGALQEQLRKKSDDVGRLKAALMNLNTFLANQSTVLQTPTPGANEGNEHITNGNVNVNANMDATSLSFEHDLDLERQMHSVKSTKSSKSEHAVSKSKRRRKVKGKASSASSSSASANSKSKSKRMKASASSGDLLDDITAVIVNKNQRERRSRHSLDKARHRTSLAKHIKHARLSQGRHAHAHGHAHGHVKSAVRRQFVPSNADKGEEANATKRSRTSALNKKMKLASV